MPIIPIDTNYTYLTQQQFFFLCAFEHWLKGQAAALGESPTLAVNRTNTFYQEAWPVIQTLDLNV